MQKALELSLKGNPSPNPLVGCVITKANKIIATGFHKKFGEAHAEINALKKAGKKAINAEIYVSLEPCTHFKGKKTPACAQAIIKSGIKKVFIALTDPNKKVKGKGIKQLKKAGIKVETGLLKEKAEKINESFIKFQKTGQPFVTLKAAITLDGKIASKTFESKWISSEESRKKVHEMRSKTDAVLTGENTVLKDNPKLTARIKGGRNPLRVIVTSKKIPSDYNVFVDSNFLIATTDKKLFSEKKFQGKILELKAKNNLVDLKKLLSELGKRNVSSLLVEGGSGIYSSFVKQKLADKLVLFIAPKILGSGIPVFGGLGVKKPEKALELKCVSFSETGKDLLLEGYF